MSITGIPPENITIDQKERIITVLMPPTLPSFELVPSFTLSRQAQLPPYWTTEKRTISLADYCSCPYGHIQSPSPLEMKMLISNQKQTTYYTIKFKSAAPLRIKSLPAPIVYDSKSTNYNVTVPVENYYGSSYVEYIAVTRTGSAFSNWIGPGGGCMENCAGLLNQVALSLSGYLVGDTKGGVVMSLNPGLYDLDLWLADGSHAQATGVILVK